MLERVQRKENSLALLVGMQTDMATLENSTGIPLKLGIKLPYEPTILLLGIYLEETITEKHTCTPMFITAQFTIARTWKQPRCPSTEE